MKTSFLFLLLEASMLHAQIRWEELTPVAKDDNARMVLNGWQQGVVERYQKGGVATADFSTWHEMSFPSLKKLFPGLRFFTTCWIDRPTPGNENKALGLDGGECTLIYSPEGKIVKELWHDGNYDPFGDFLAANKVAIRSAEDAGLVWDAFCHVHQKHWQDQLAIKVSKAKWHLGNTTISGVHYYYEVNLDKNQVVQAARLHAEHLDKAKSK